MVIVLPILVVVGGYFNTVTESKERRGCRMIVFFYMT